MKPEHTTSWVSHGQTNVGKLRRLNEDNLLELPGQNMWLVADGMGGHAAGGISSQLIVDSLRRFKASKFIGHSAHNLMKILDKVNRELSEYAMSKSLGVIGSTVALLLIDEHYCVTIWAGDSRVYRLRNGFLRQLTIDHDQTTELMKMGIGEKEALAMPGSEAIMRAIGSEESRLPQVNIQEIQPGDRFLLCTDGLTKEVNHQELESVVKTMPGEEAVPVLMEACLNSGARDNVTLMVVEKNPDRQ